MPELLQRVYWRFATSLATRGINLGSLHRPEQRLIGLSRMLTVNKTQKGILIVLLAIPIVDLRNA